MARTQPSLGLLVLALTLFCSYALAMANAGLDPHSETAGQMTHHEKRYGSGLPWWHAQIKRQGTAPYQPNSTYAIYRNVKDYGAKADGITDDTDAINNATQDGRNCIFPCDSSTTTPAIVYFPPGTYIVSRPLIMTYNTQYVGDVNNLPVLRATPDFYGIAILDANPYLPFGFNWYQNQNNFYRHIRNFVLDITQVPSNVRQAYCLHWQVAQATSLQNIVFNMAPATNTSTQIGIFMDNGSGGYIEDLIFNGGNVAFFSGNQQFTVRNLTFNNCNTAIYQNWNWLFNYKDVAINNCLVGIDMTQGGAVITTGSLILQDSIMTNVGVGVLTNFAHNSTPTGAGTFVMDNVDFVDTPVAVAYPNGTVIVQGNRKVPSFVQGTAYTAYEEMEVINNLTCYEATATRGRIQQEVAAPPKPASLLDENGNFYIRTRPQYEGIPVTSFVSSFDYGCIGDGVSDDTECIQNFLNSIRSDQIAFINHGAYVIRDTINVPINIKIIGEAWPLLMIDGSSNTFNDIDNPKPAFRVGSPGESGAVEMVELIFETLGPAPGAILMEWNLAQTYQGSNGMWDTHWRIGGTNGTKLQSSNCLKTPNLVTSANPNCIGAFLLTHITRTGQVLMSNNWGWVSDHELDLKDHSQINIYNGRGLLLESDGPVWVYGGSYEHSVFYNYQIANAKDVYLSLVQSETAYMQNNPNSLQPFTPLASWYDPDFASCFSPTCAKTWGFRVYNSTYVFVYGAGLYSFFNNYDSACIITTSCQQFTTSIELSAAIYLYALSTVATEYMVQVDNVALAPAVDNVNSFCDTVGVFEYP